MKRVSAKGAQFHKIRHSLHGGRCCTHQKYYFIDQTQIIRYIEAYEKLTGSVFDDFVTTKAVGKQTKKTNRLRLVF